MYNRCIKIIKSCTSLQQFKMVLSYLKLAKDRNKLTCAEYTTLLNITKTQLQFLKEKLKKAIERKNRTI